MIEAWSEIKKRELWTIKSADLIQCFYVKQGHFNSVLVIYPIAHPLKTRPKQPSRGVLRKSCSESMDQNYRRTPSTKNTSGRLLLTRKHLVSYCFKVYEMGTLAKNGLSIAELLRRTEYYLLIFLLLLFLFVNTSIANPKNWSNTLKQFVGCWGWCLKG